MDSFIFSKDETKHKEIISQSYNGYLKSDDMKLLNFFLEDNIMIVAVNSCIFRVFSPLLNSILSDTTSDVQDVILPDFSVESCALLIEILRTGKTSFNENSKLDELKSLALTLRIDMENLRLDASDSDLRVKISPVSQMFVESNVPNLHKDLEELKADIDADVRNNNDTTKDKEIQRSADKISRKKYNQIKEEIEELKSKVSTLKKEKKEVTKERNDKSKALSSMQTKVDHLETKLKSKFKEVVDLEKQVTSLKHQVKEYYWKLDDAEKRTGYSHFPQEEPENLLREIAAKGKEIFRLRKKWEEAKSDADNLSAKLKESEKALDIEEEKKRSLNSSLIAEIRKLEDDLKSNKKSLDASRKECSSLKQEKEKLMKDATEVTTVLEDLEKEVERCKNLQTSDLDQGALKQQISSLKQDNEKLQKEANLAERAVQLGEASAQHVETFKKEVNKLKLENDKLKDETKGAKTDLANLQRELALLKNAQPIETSDQENTNMRKENESVQELRLSTETALMKENNTLKQLNNTFIKENRNLKQGYCTLQEENVKLKKVDMEVKASLASLQQEVELYKNAQPADLTKELEKSKANSEKLSKELEESQKRITQLQQICSGGRGNTGSVMTPRPSVMRGRGSLLGIPHPYGYGPLPPGAPGYRFFRF